MSLSKEQVLDRLRQVKGPDLKGNIVDLGLVSEILLKDGRVSFSITVPAERASELDVMRQAAEKVVRDMEGVSSVIAVLTADKPVRRRRERRRSRVGQPRKAPGFSRRAPGVADGPAPAAAAPAAPDCRAGSGRCSRWPASST